MRGAVPVWRQVEGAGRVTGVCREVGISQATWLRLLRTLNQPTQDVMQVSLRLALMISLWS